MGEVYRARDTKFGRDVALKILPDSFAHDAERVARFKREAQLLASLNHPNIAQIYGLDRQEGRDGQDGTTFIVMELVDGDELAQRIVRDEYRSCLSSCVRPTKEGRCDNRNLWWKGTRDLRVRRSARIRSSCSVRATSPFSCTSQR
jgi:serine/threonine protein kinase